MDARTFAEKLTKIQTQYAQAYMEGWENYWKLTSSLSREKTSLADAQKRYADFAAKQAPATFNKLLETTIDYYGTVLDAGSQMSREFFTAMSPATQPKNPETASPSERPSTELFFEGVPGEKPARQFVVANKTPKPITVAFELSEFISDRGETVRQAAEISPDGFTLEPGAEQVLDCRVPITASFAPGCSYRALLRASGLPEMRVLLCAVNLGETAETIVVDEPRKPKRRNR